MVNNSDTKVTYRGNGQTTVFPFSFPFISKEYIHVAIYDELTDETTILTSDYYVDATAQTVTYPGYEPGQEPPESVRPSVLPYTSTLTIYRQTDIDQLTDLGEKYPLPAIEAMVDKLTEILQEQKESIGRAIKAEIGSPYTPEQMYKNMQDNAEMVQQAVVQTGQDALETRQNALSAAADRQRAETAAADAENAAGIAQTAAREAEESALKAGVYTEDVGMMAKDAENIMAGYAAYTAPPWQADTVYSYPTVVSYTDGNTYRCIGQNLPAGTRPDSSKYWIRITTRGGDDFFDIDSNGDLMPAVFPTASYAWTLDENGDIMPKGASDDLGREPQTVAEEALAAALEAVETAEELLASVPMEVDSNGDVTTTEAPVTAPATESPSTEEPETNTQGENEGGD